MGWRRIALINTQDWTDKSVIQDKEYIVKSFEIQCFELQFTLFLTCQALEHGSS